MEGNAMKNDPLIEAQLGAYHIQSLLGEGGMARVYKAFHERLQREVAIKIILPENAGMTDFQRRFQQEAQLIARLQHRNIVAVYDFGESQNLVYLVMQYVAGGTLRDQLADGQPLEPRRAALYALQMARALHHAHQYGIVHRDVKPLNMLVSATNRNELLLSDFGLAKLFSHGTETLPAAQPSQGKDTNQMLSAVGDITGTPRYMAPEQCLGKPVDARTDIYALGVILFEMLTGRPLFQGETTFSLLHQHAYTSAPSVHEVNPFVPEALTHITARALAKKPEERYQSAREMGHALEAFLSPPVFVAHPTTPSSERRVKKPTLSYLIIGMLLILAMLAQVLISHGIIRWPTSTATTTTQSTSIQPTAQVPTCTLAPHAPQAQPFIETFHNNQHGWRENSGNDVTSTIGGSTYTLAVGNTNSLLFLCPDSTQVGTLPENFNLTAQIAQKQGSSDVYYGIAFHLRLEKDTNNVYSYAFVINGRGTWALLKYDPHLPNGPTTLKSGVSTSSIHDTPASNTLQVIAQGSNFTFKVNGTLLSINGIGQADQTMIDSSYTGGLLALAVSGPNANFVVTSVQLTIP